MNVHAKWEGPEARADAYQNVLEVRIALTHLLYEIMPVPNMLLHEAALALEEAIQALLRTEEALDAAVQEVRPK
jgi:hypothetical protein